MTTSLQQITLGNVLAPAQKEKLLAWLKVNNVTGNARIRGAVPAGWIVGDKTGTGLHYGTTNDIAVIWPPKCAPIVVAIYYTTNKKTSPKREDIDTAAARIILDAFAQTDKCIKREYSLAKVAAG